MMDVTGARLRAFLLVLNPLTNDDADFESVVTFGIQKFDTDSLSKMLKLVRQGGRGA